MTPEVIDASVAVEWFVETSPAFRSALAVLDRVQEDPGSFVVPQLFFQEVHAVLCRVLASPGEVGTALRHLWRLGVQCIPWEPGVADRAAELAFQFRISAYDATYLATAQMVEGIWLTFDRKAHEKVASLGLSRLA